MKDYSKMRWIDNSTKDRVKTSGSIDIVIFNLDGSIKRVDHIENQVKDVWVNALRDAEHGLVTDLQIKYVAWGSSNTANALNQTKLVAEFGRKAITSQTNASTGQLITVVYVAPAEANTPKIEEMGWFAGSLATDTTDSGILVARVLYSHQKTDLESIQVARTSSYMGV